MMAKEEKQEESKEEQEPLNPEQRLDILEKKVGSNKLILISLALFLIIIISVSVTVFVLGVAGGEDEGNASNSAMIQLQADVDQVKEQLLGLDTKLAKLNSEMQLLEVKLANSGNRVIQATMIEQEQYYQTFLSSLRSAIFDLAHMVPGSRSWLELYSDQIDQSLVHSNKRIEKLKKLESSEEKVDTFFGDF